MDEFEFLISDGKAGFFVEFAFGGAKDGFLVFYVSGWNRVVAVFIAGVGSFEHEDLVILNKENVYGWDAFGVDFHVCIVTPPNPLFHLSARLRMDAVQRGVILE